MITNFYKDYLEGYMRGALDHVIGDIEKLDIQYGTLPGQEEADRHTFFNGVEIKEGGEVPYYMARPLRESLEICIQHIREFKKENYGRPLLWRLGPQIIVDESNLKSFDEAVNVPVLIRYRIFVFKNIKGECY